MPRRNRNPKQQATHKLDRFERWAEEIIAENGRKPPANSNLTSEKIFLYERGCE
jgi:hypothetical protein